MSKKSILIADDEALMRDSLEATLSRQYRVDVAKDGKGAIAKLDDSDYDLILSDLRMPGASGMDVLKATRQRQPDAKFVMMTAYGSLENHAECMKEGAFIYVMKPFTPDEIETVVEKALDYQRLSVENRQLRSELESRFSLGSLIGRSPCMVEILDLIRTVADSRSTALVTGESGTGKELAARAIHYNSPRLNGPFIKINCAVLPRELIESELFGHEKGAFTSAIRQTRGRFELADGGTLLLDEISEINLSLQAKLLRVLQEREFERSVATTPSRWMFESWQRPIETCRRRFRKDGSGRTSFIVYTSSRFTSRRCVSERMISPRSQRISWRNTRRKTTSAFRGSRRRR